MARNALKFEHFLEEQKIVIDKQVNDEGVVYMVREAVPGFGPASVALLFNNNDRMVTIVSYQYLKITNPEQKLDVMSLINTINSEYTMVKFTEADDFVTVQIALPFKDNFVPELIAEMVSMLLQAMQEEQPRFAGSSAEPARAA